MTQNKFFKIRLFLTAIVTIAIWMLLTWNHFHGGVPSHHILADKNLPAISNWWGAVLLPLLTWLLLFQIQKGAFHNRDGAAELPTILRWKLLGFLGALLFGVALATCFSFGYADFCGYLVLGLFPLALFLPIYKAQFLLGFVLGMTFTFGAVIPTVVGALLSLAGLLLYRYIRPVLLFIGAKLALVRQPRK